MELLASVLQLQWWKVLLKIEFFVILQAFCILQSVVCENSEIYAYEIQDTIQSGDDSEPGEWYPVENCPKNSIVTGFDLEYLPYQGSSASTGHIFGHIFSLGITYAVQHSLNIFDDRGVTRIFLDCTNVRTKEHEAWIAPLPETCVGQCINAKTGHKILGNKMGKDSTLSCPQKRPAIGFQIKNEMNKGSLGDHFGTVNFKLVCSGPLKNLPNPNIHFESVTNAKWSDPVMCPEGSAVCGIQPKVNIPPNPALDSSGLTDVRLQCCPVKTPTLANEDCRPEVVNKTVSHSNNCNETPLSLTVRLSNTITTSKEIGSGSSESNGGFSTNTLGFNAKVSKDFAIVKAELALKFERQFGKHWNSVLENQLKNIDTTGQQTEQTLAFEIPAMHSGHVNQILLQCGGTVAATKIIRIINRPLTAEDCRKRRNL